MEEWRIGPRSFEEFFAQAERPVRFALCARFGFETGREATAEAFAYAWEHWDRIATMDNPEGYVFRVGQRIGGRVLSRPRPVDFVPNTDDLPMVEPGLAPALAALSNRQRTVVVLVHGLGMTHVEAAGWLGTSASTVQRHLERAMPRLRVALGVSDDV